MYWETIILSLGQGSKTPAFSSGRYVYAYTYMHMQNLMFTATLSHHFVVTKWQYSFDFKSLTACRPKPLLPPAAYWTCLSLNLNHRPPLHSMYLQLPFFFWPKAQKVHAQEVSKELFDELKRNCKSTTWLMGSEGPSIPTSADHVRYSTGWMERSPLLASWTDLNCVRQSEPSMTQERSCFS